MNQQASSSVGTGTSIFGVQPGTPPSGYSDKQLELMMGDIVRHTFGRKNLTSLKLTKLESLEAEWAKRHGLQKYQYIS